MNELHIYWKAAIPDEELRQLLSDNGCTEGTTKTDDCDKPYTTVFTEYDSKHVAFGLDRNSHVQRVLIQ
ncbi:hypothetical protein CL614_01750 [archaeon]|nr:hypothetical protein [archaeon]|tara:strand:- start:1623 stop:1829 length:207 start_codon:yes stop_codon:yes gene_type:complete